MFACTFVVFLDRVFRSFRSLSFPSPRPDGLLRRTALAMGVVCLLAACASTASATQSPGSQAPPQPSPASPAPTPSPARMPTPPQSRTPAQSPTQPPPTRPTAPRTVPTTSVRVRAMRSDAPITVDGRLDEQVWQTAPAAGDFLQVEPAPGEPATEQTELRLAYDSGALYVGVRLHDRAPDQIVRRLSRRDLLADADRFAIYLDPQHDHLTGVELRVSAAGVQQDAIIYNDNFEDFSWDAVWDSAVSVDEQGWSLEMKIPFSQLRFQRTEPMVWGINAQRIVRRKNEESWLVMVPRNESGLASRLGHLDGLEQLPRAKHIELLPYASMRGEFLEPRKPGNPFDDGSRLFGGAGADAKYRMTSTLTLDATFNPDFGQVEVDPAVVNLTANEVFFEERRPFFVEGNQFFTNFGKDGARETWGFFRTEPNLFYSRRVGRAPQVAADGEFIDQPAFTTILGAAKLTGRTRSGWTLGLLDAVTGREYADLARGATRDRAMVEPLTNYLVARAHRELGARAGFSLITTVTNRELPTELMRDRLVSHAVVAGADAHYFFDRKRDWVVTGGVAGSQLSGTASAIDRVQRNPARFLQRPDQPHTGYDPARTSLGGWTGHVDVNKNTGNVVVNGSIWGMSPGFDSNDLGFMNQGDRGGAHAMVQWRKLTPDRFTRSRAAWVSKWWTYNWRPDLQGDGWQMNGRLEFRNYWRLASTGTIAKRTWDDRLTRGGPETIRPGGKTLSVTASTDPRTAVSVTATGTINAKEFGGWSRTGELVATFKPAPSIELSIGPKVFVQRNPAQYVREAADALAVDTFGRRYVFADLDQTEVTMTTRVNWAFTPTLSLQVYAQPLLSVGEFTQYKELAAARTFDFRRYGIDAGTLGPNPASPGGFLADPDGPAGPASPFAFANQDFNIKSLRLNTILRWQWHPGSTLYFVWTEQRQNSAWPGAFALGRDTRALLSAPADDVLMVKVTYWIGR